MNANFSPIGSIRPTTGAAILSSILIAALSCGFSDDPFFPKGCFVAKAEYAEVDQSIADSLKRHFEALNERSLYQESRSKSPRLAFRLLWQPPNGKSICVYLCKTQAMTSIRESRNEIEDLTATPPKIRYERTLNITEAQWKAVLDAAEKADLWSLPSDVRENRGIADDQLLLLEGLRPKCYIIAKRARSIATKSYLEFCRTLMSLAGPPTLKEWDESAYQREKN